MKKVINFLFFSIFILSCQKEAIVTSNEVKSVESTTNTASPRTEGDIIEYYHNELPITSTHFGEIMENTHNLIYLNGDPNNPNIRIIKIMAFDTKEQYIAKGNELNLRLDKEIEAAEHLHQYALETGAIDAYEATGVVPESYLTYEKQYLLNLQGLQGKAQNRLVAFLKKSCSSPGLPLPFLNGGMPFMPPTWNNEVSEITSINAITGTMAIFDKAFYIKRVATLSTGNFIFGSTTLCFTTLIPGIDDAMSSGLNLTL